MAVKRKKATARKPFWERSLENGIGLLKKLLLPALVIWLIGWLWLGGVFETTKNMMWDGFVNWTAEKGLVVTDVVIEGRFRTDLSSLQNAIQTQLNDPVLNVDVDAVQSRIEQLRWVADATVARHYNGVIRVNITERIPFVLWNRPGRGMVVVDTKGAIIKGANPDNFSELLMVKGVGAPEFTVELMQMVLAEPDVADHIRAAEWIGDRRWDLLTVKGTRVHLPENDMGFALSRLAKSQAEKNILNRDFLSIDLRANDRIIIETERGKSQDMMNLSSVSETNSI